jgi:hypothetical protein
MAALALAIRIEPAPIEQILLHWLIKHFVLAGEPRRNRRHLHRRLARLEDCRQQTLFVSVQGSSRLLQLQRIAHLREDRPFDTTPNHIFVADEKYKLGVSDLRRIEVVKLGWMEGALI